MCVKFGGLPKFLPTSLILIVMQIGGMLFSRLSRKGISPLSSKYFGMVISFFANILLARRERLSDESILNV